MIQDVTDAVALMYWYTAPCGLKVRYVRYAGRMAIGFLRATSCTCGTRSVVGNNMGRDGDDAWT
jgi:hypothetical protein